MTSEDPDRQPALAVDQDAVLSGNARAYQAGRDLQVTETVLPEGALRPVEQVAARQGLMNVPVVGLFIGRGEELSEVEEALASSGDVVIAAVHGLGGIGKSTLAARYARQQAEACNPVWWITADSAAAIQAGLAALAVGLQPELARAMPLEALAARAVAWLGCHPDWLLVLDNVTDPADIAPLLARTRTGRVVVTSRLADAWHEFGATLIRLDVLSEAEALALLRRRASLTSVSGAGTERAEELVAELGWLPLAVEQAAAYLRQTRTTPSRYLDLLAEAPAVMYDRTARGADGQRTIARIWRISLDSMADVPLAGQLLRVLAWYAPEAAPRWLLDGIADPVEVVEALGILAAYNMIILDERTVTVHRLVQAVARTPDPLDPHRQGADIDVAREQATELLNQARPATVDDPAQWPAWRALLPHIDGLADHTTPATDTLSTALLLSWTTAFLSDQGLIHRAITYQKRGLATFQRLRGADDLGTLTSRNNLAGAYRSAGDLERAIPLYEATLADRERVLGPDHPDILVSRNNLASAYKSAGDLARALPLFEATLTSAERMLGPDHPDTLRIRINLAGAYESAGDLARAIPFHEATLTSAERVLGPDHPNTLACRNNLAFAYRSAGDLARAIPLYKATLTSAERMLGPDHPNTLRTRHNLGGAYESAGDLARAIPLYEATLADRERVLGPDHPETLVSRNYLAGAYESAGDLARAIPLYEATLADHERVLGPDHPETLVSRNNLASAYESAGDLAHAIPLFETTLTSAERVLGPDHPETLVSRNNLASAYESAGDLARAISLHEATLTSAERVLGPDHPNTLASRNNLAFAYRSAGNLARAIPLFETTLTSAKRVLGPDHPVTRGIRENLEAARQRD